MGAGVSPQPAMRSDQTRSQEVGETHDSVIANETSETGPPPTGLAAGEGPSQAHVASGAVGSAGRRRGDPVVAGLSSHTDVEAGGVGRGGQG